MRRRRPSGLKKAGGWCFTLGLLALAQARSDDGESLPPDNLSFLPALHTLSSRRIRDGV